ncbi:MAG: epimerase [Fimbriimonas ginsengisoli]|uniref:Epimerase n=1 Tax=Fimbriimonas ginsengisoli TaxID=1005039 RepID=A0A931LTE8_FIMGI|nr:epimerase [Fimbriimonas ginsengisoli]
MRVLIIGGTRFVGRVIAEEAFRRGHELTIFHRGNTNQGLFPAAREVLGDREHDLHLISDQRFDAVLDTSGYVPRIVRLSCEALTSASSLYVFVSTISVYPDGTQAPKEDSPLQALADPTVEQVNANTYGGLKALCEQEVLISFANRALILRPGLIIGPWDHTDRFTYWAARAARGGRFPVPTEGGQPLQLIDARDQAAFALDQVEALRAGIVNVAAPPEPYRFDEVLRTCARVADSEIEPVFLPEAARNAPLCVDEGDYGLMHADTSLARARGLRSRPLADTVGDLLAWDRERGNPVLGTGLTSEEEEELLALRA